MNHCPSFLRKTVALVATLMTAAALARGAEVKATVSTNKYAGEVAKLAAAPAPAPGGILLVGSSIFRKWTNCVEMLAPLPVRNNAFGGSQTKDQLFYFDQIVPASRAALVVWYCGSNDVNGKKSPEYILANTKQWVEMTRAALPGAHIVLVSVIRAPQKRRDGYLATVDAANQALRELAAAVPNVTYVDVNPALEDAQGEPVMACYVADQLHLTQEGYRRMTTVLKPVMEQHWKPAPVSPSPVPPARE
jgi:GDSL-like Lipase/Acylhydrolase family